MIGKARVAIDSQVLETAGRDPREPVYGRVPDLQVFQDRELQLREITWEKDAIKA
jgi:hypothetical protein